MLTIGFQILGMQQSSSFLKRSWFAVILDGCVFPLVAFVSEAVASVGIKRNGKIVVVEQGYDDHETYFRINRIIPVRKGDMPLVLV